MSRRKTAPEAPARRDLILAEAASLFARKGVAATTVREIADAVDIQAGSLYHWFESKEEMVDELLTGAMDDLATRYQEAVEEHTEPLPRLRALVHAAFQVIAAHPDACTVYLRDYTYLTTLPRFAHLDESSLRVRALWIDTLEAGIAAGEVRADLAPDLVYRYLTYPLWLSVGWHRTSGHSLEELEEQFLRLVLDGVNGADSDLGMNSG
ncbi:MAG: TetR/AcrR family transcriptional regulator, partial [Streptomycetaceae bacterium]|nr:TetR/AcrR family transcriptional regulator [Streptomycetaceae bacterium]